MIGRCCCLCARLDAAATRTVMLFVVFVWRGCSRPSLGASSASTAIRRGLTVFLALRVDTRGTDPGAKHDSQPKVVFSASAAAELPL
jgi:hypothetical protein